MNRRLYIVTIYILITIFSVLLLRFGSIISHETRKLEIPLQLLNHDNYSSFISLDSLILDKAVFYEQLHLQILNMQDSIQLLKFFKSPDGTVDCNKLTAFIFHSFSLFNLSISSIDDLAQNKSVMTLRIQNSDQINVLFVIEKIGDRYFVIEMKNIEDYLVYLDRLILEYPQIK